MASVRPLIICRSSFDALFPLITRIYSTQSIENSNGLAASLQGLSNPDFAAYLKDMR